MAFPVGKHSASTGKPVKQVSPKTSVQKASPNPKKAESPANLRTVFGTPKKQK